jgi:hypothetical protein
MRIGNPFHSGELEAQRLAGGSATAIRNSAVIADTIMAAARPFLAQQRMLVLGSASGDGRVWASPVFGEPGFVTSEDGAHVILDRQRIRENKRDPLWTNLAPGAHLGLLAIDLTTRRRLRVNGLVQSAGSGRLVLAVAEAYPNCPKYIERRTLDWIGGAAEHDEANLGSGVAMTPAFALLVDGAGTMFIASAHPDRGADVSHRGGAPGFIQCVDPLTIRVPDYPGNNLFNTFGNLLVSPQAGVTILNFDRGQIAQATGEATIEWDRTDEEDATLGTGRFWTFKIESWRIYRMPAASAP